MKDEHGYMADGYYQIVVKEWPSEGLPHWNHYDTVEGADAAIRTGKKIKKPVEIWDNNGNCIYRHNRR